ncbi:MAG: ribonuclease VapC30 [Proteobacteria bacterium]|nr:ribonuclease VapC30 [Pseudomonadota bacterium]
MFVDASAIIAILSQEPEKNAFIDALEGTPLEDRITSAIAVWEAIAGLARRMSIPLAVAESDVREFLGTASINVIPLTLDHLSPALDALDRYSRHCLPESERNKALNLGDCFHYAAARRAGTGILHKDAGLALTDLPRS